ncbi:MAG: hypothetical protein CMJ25_14375 [Phycisphaerae bacterium]|nr:hypothetical protein [Phycisphaerae bacterium]|tara:strand:- start:81 stop:311 length:231 start_codon:yes stop_codon:yes gene_type:complete
MSQMQFDMDLISPVDEDDLVVEVASEHGLLFRLFKERDESTYYVKPFDHGGVPVDAAQLVDLVNQAVEVWKRAELR